jgi:hypothetical protein
LIKKVNNIREGMLLTNLRLVFFCVLVAVLLVACGAKATGPAENAPLAPAKSSEQAAAAPATEPGAVARSGYFAEQVDPINVTVNLEAEQSSEDLIGAQGGSLSATAADGTVYTLEVPAQALVMDTMLRMIPVSNVEGMPFGSGQAYTVQFEPEGLQFYVPVILTIAPLEGMPIGEQLFFNYQGNGEGLGLAAPVVESSEIKLVIDHFSGYGVTKGLLADIEPLRKRLGGAAERRLESLVAEKLAAERQRQILGAEGESDLDFADYFKQYEEQVVKPRLAAAGDSCAAARLAIQTVLGMERQRQLLGLGEGGLELGGLMDTAATVCMKEEYEMCRDDHIIHRIIPAWLGLERQYALLGMSENAVPAVLQEAQEYVRKCLNFELEFHSDGVFDDTGGGYDSTVEAKVKLQFDFAEMKLKGTAPLVNTAFNFKTEGCSVTSNRGGAEFTAVGLVYIADKHSVTDELGYVRDMRLVYYPGNTTESFTVKCLDSPPYTSPPSPMWTGIFLPLHELELSPAEGGFLAEDWGVPAGELFAQKEWVNSNAGIGITETGTFKLYHRPD